MVFLSVHGGTELEQSNKKGLGRTFRPHPRMTAELALTNSVNGVKIHLAKDLRCFHVVESIGLEG